MAELHRRILGCNQVPNYSANLPSAPPRNRTPFCWFVANRLHPAYSQRVCVGRLGAFSHTFPHGTKHERLPPERCATLAAT